MHHHTIGPQDGSQPRVDTGNEHQVHAAPQSAQGTETTQTAVTSDALAGVSSEGTSTSPAQTALSIEPNAPPAAQDENVPKETPDGHECATPEHLTGDEPRDEAMQTDAASCETSKGATPAGENNRDDTTGSSAPPGSDGGQSVQNDVPAESDEQRENSDDARDTGASHKRPRSPSPDDDPDFASQPPPRPTIRLDVVIDPQGTSKRDYIVNIPRMAVNRMREQHPQWAAWYSAMYLDSGIDARVPDPGLSQQELNDLGGLAKLLKKYPSAGTVSHKKRRQDEYDVGSYDTKDPFVDDSELAYDEPAFCVKMRTNGFYVAAGPVEFETKEARPSAASSSALRSSLANSKGASQRMAGYAGLTNKLLAKRAASKKVHPAEESAKMDENAATATPSPTEHKPTETPAPMLPAPAPALAPMPEKNLPVNASKVGDDSAESKAKKNKYPIRPVHPQLQQMFDNLSALVQRASFAVKTKFPTELKPPLVETAKLAVELDEYNENFFNYLPSIFPYNRFTMMVRHC